ncbi:ABC transporter ATP-binding protein [Aureimonas frigidaquae]|uniref:ATPase component of various ABC-type transport systems with duplicated ATPase domain n=1 Tax=Aureimonas frigidaquae TaxID=424757 RepID=A0A0N7KY21_9HYPH|nr:ABC transporter ATP-binding protein [Aureimonas frigidaquae]BAT28505.1 ATPase component of various ABC-type transport systems with duplicated ATPase domain [Aureimonas frigidaquae]
MMDRTVEAGPLLDVADLTVTVGGTRHPRAVVDGLSFSLQRGETLCLAGESGSGKSVTSLAIMGLLPRPATRLAAGSIRLAGQELTQLAEPQMQAIRGARIAMIFQEPMTSLNPVLTIGRQLTETVLAHRGVPAAEARRMAISALDAVRIPRAAERMGAYPHEMSGGQRQRVMIAMALMLRPDVLIADEPTTALDVTVQAQVLDLLRELQSDLGTAILLITHDMGVVAQMGARVVVMRHGRKVEENTTAAFFRAQETAYARDLLAAVPRIGAGPGHQPTRQLAPAAPVLDVRGLTVSYPGQSGLLIRKASPVQAVKGVSFQVAAGETFSLVGESGCGKSTTARALMGLVPFGGEVILAGAPLSGRDAASARQARRDLSMIFQDPYASLDPRMTAGDLVREPLDIHRIGTLPERRDRVADLFARVGLPQDAMGRYPHEFSGGQRQRLAIARALALRPRLIVADESVSALDVSVKARVLDLLRVLQAEFGIAYLFISHDMAVVENISDRVAVMLNGRIVETAPRDVLFNDPRHPYTQRLIEAVPVPDPAARPRRRHGGAAPAGGELPTPSGALAEIAPGHWVAGAAA